MNISVCGAGGAIGGHLVNALVLQGHNVTAVDIKPKGHWWQVNPAAHNIANADCSDMWVANQVTTNQDHVYNLAENMGGIGFITENRVDCAESIEIGIALLRASAENGVQRFFFSSSACVYNTALQDDVFSVPQLKEEDAWPANPEEGYGFSKLYMEELCRHYAEERGLQTRVARYHNVYGNPGSWRDGREKAPAAICRKIAEAAKFGTDRVTVWGDGSAMRSYLHVSDCVSGTIALMNSEYDKPLNIGSTRSISVNELVHVVERIAGTSVDVYHDLSGAVGVNGRNADISRAKAFLHWEPTVELEEGLTDLYRWIYDQL